MKPMIGHSAPSSAPRRRGGLRIFDSDDIVAVLSNLDPPAALGVAESHMLRAIGNFFWFVLGGLLMGLAWWLVGLICFVSIIGIPWGRACFVIGKFHFLPFGREAISRKTLTLRDDVGTGPFGLIGNIVWFVLAGIWLAIGHVCSAILCFLTIIGIPFGIQHLKLAGLALAPVGKTVVLKEVAEAARRTDADLRVASLRG